MGVESGLRIDGVFGIDLARSRNDIRHMRTPQLDWKEPVSTLPPFVFAQTLPTRINRSLTHCIFADIRYRFTHRLCCFLPQF